MPTTYGSKLLNLTTDFKKLKYGSDQRDGGSSGQPFVQNPLPENANSEQRDLYEKIRTSIDFTLRTGGINPEYERRNRSLVRQLFGGTIVPLTGTADDDRINAFLKTMRGKLFVQKQAALGIQNPKYEVKQSISVPDNTGRTFFGALWNNFANSNVLEYTRIFRKENLQQQVAYQGTGYHFDRPGNLAVTPVSAKYEAVVTNSNKKVSGKDYTNNRLETLYRTKMDLSIVTRSGRRVGLGSLDDTTLDNLNRLGISRQVPFLFQYVGGPNSGGDQGSTFIRRVVDTNPWQVSSEQRFFVGTPSVRLSASGSYLEKLLNSVDNVTVGSNYSTINLPRNQQYVNQGSRNVVSQIYVRRYEDTFTPTTNASKINQSPNLLSYKQISNKKRNLTGDTRKDFRSEVTIPESYIKSDYTGEWGKTYRSRVLGTGDPGYFEKNIGDYGKDQINALDIGKEPENGIKDLIKCKMVAVQTNGSDPYEVPLVFRAFLSDFADNYTAGYDEHQYVGRAEKFQTYKSADRKISFTLMIAAQSQKEMKPLYRKLNYLVSQTYPAYASSGIVGTGFMRAPLMKITIGDYLYDQPGFINSIQLSVDKNVPWEIDSDDTNYQLPHIIKAAINFTPIHNFLPRRSWHENNDYKITPFITPNKGNKGNNFGIGKS